MLIYARQEETVDEICWRYYGRTQQAVEQVYAANPGLAEKGPTLPRTDAKWSYRICPRRLLVRRSICGISANGKNQFSD